MRLKHRFVAVGAVALAACISSSAPDLCSDPVTLSFTATPTPTLAWTPNCRVDNLLVETPLPPSVGLGSEVTWQIAARAEGDGAAAPVRYGVAPLSMEELVSADPLEAGRFYLVRISVAEVVMGQLNFQYWPPD